LREASSEPQRWSHPAGVTHKEKAAFNHQDAPIPVF
jgi:hypothetical protein